MPCWLFHEEPRLEHVCHGRFSFRLT
jgi:hypothetical protein